MPETARSPRAPSLALPVGLALAGVALLLLCARAWRIDRAGSGNCEVWTSLREGVALAALYLVGLALLVWAWLRARKTDAPLRHVLAAGALVHGVALLLPPFLSFDPDYYAALARAMATYHASPDTALSLSLPPTDPFFTILPAYWQRGTSGYGPLFDALAWLVGKSGLGLTGQLHLFQLAGAACMLATARLVASAGGSRAAALVLFCPLAIIEGTMNAHIDCLLAVSAAGFVVLASRGRAGLLPLALGVAAKLSGALLFVFSAVERALRPIAGRLRARGLVPLLAVACASVVAVLVVFGDRPPLAATVTPLFGRPDELIPHCTRSIECAPRALLALGLGIPRAAWQVSLVFRLLGGLWLLTAAWLAARDGRPLAWAATALFVYYLFFHGFMQSWYLLSLLPLVPFASPRLRPAMETFLVSALVYYALRQPTNCMLEPAVVLTREVAEAVIVIVPPGVLLLRAASAPSPA